MSGVCAKDLALILKEIDDSEAHPMINLIEELIRHHFDNNPTAHGIETYWDVYIH